MAIDAVVAVLLLCLVAGCGYAPLEPVPAEPGHANAATGFVDVTVEPE